MKRYVGQDKVDGSIISTIYYQLFIGQLTSKELTTLKSGGFLLDGDTKATVEPESEDEGEEGEDDEDEDEFEGKVAPPFDITALEECCSRSASQFPKNFHMDSRTSDYLRESKRGYELTSENFRSPVGTKRKSSALYADVDEDKQGVLLANSPQRPNRPLR